MSNQCFCFCLGFYLFSGFSSSLLRSHPDVTSMVDGGGVNHQTSIYRYLSSVADCEDFFPHEPQHVPGVAGAHPNVHHDGGGSRWPARGGGAPRARAAERPAGHGQHTCKGL